MTDRPIARPSHRPIADRVRIRVATAADIPALHALIERSVRELQSDDYTPAQIDGALGHALGLDTQLVADGTYFVAEPVITPPVITPPVIAPPAPAPHAPANVLAACGGWSARATLFGSDHGPGRASTFLDPATDAAKIRAIFVHPDWARQGLGSAILDHCERAARAAGFTRLEMGSTLTGVPLYRRRGYVERERVDVPLPNGEALPVIRMVKTT
jgi:GNAT superfamily N-acetyltransferase